MPAIRIVWIDAERHREAAARWLDGPSTVSFVDSVSFDVMREFGVRRAFALDRDFETAGFDVTPERAA